MNGKNILITGGTGSFGNQMTQSLLREHDPAQITILSRDEKKQHDMRTHLHDPRLRYIIGDVRDKDVVAKAMKHTDMVFHAAALKQVPTCEYFPLEAVKTNILGSSNVLDAAEEAGAEKVIILSTDKAVYPINAMGMTKALLEKLMTAKARLDGDTVYCGVRYGNVMFSRGSVLPTFLAQIKEDTQLTVTNPDMTRFLLPLPEAIDLVFYALSHGRNGDIMVRKSPASTIRNLAVAMTLLFNHTKGIKTIGVREGEKMHETLVTREELIRSQEYDSYYRIRNLERINYDEFFTSGKYDSIPADGYTSENTTRLNLDETVELLLQCDQVKQELNAEPEDILGKINVAEQQIQR